LSAAVLLGWSSQIRAEAKITYDKAGGQVVVSSGSLELIVETASGLNPRSLRDVKSGWVFADRDYAWPGDAGFPKLLEPPVITNQENGTSSVVFQGQLGSLRVEQSFTVPKNEPGVILENITIRNSTDASLDTAGFKCGFARHLGDGETWVSDASEIRFCRIPYRRETNGTVQEFPLREVAEHGTTFASWCNWPPQTTPIWGSEGWVWSKGPASLLIAKYNPEGMEWSLMEPVKQGKETLLRFGGAGQWKYGHPEGATQLEPGKSYRFGETRFQALDGNWKPAYYAFRKYMDNLGCRPAKGYNPPVHWNELYDNEYFFKGASICNYDVDQVELRAKLQKLMQEFYTLDAMKGEAAKAKELGCEALYLDPGWDSPGCSFLWDAPRLGSFGAFRKLMQEEYGLKVSVWCGLGGVPPTWADPASCPVEAQVLNKEGKRTQILCFPNAPFLDTRARCLLELAQQGMAFFMFDSTTYSGPCYDKSHGHQVPSTREEHAQALFELARRIKAKCPDALIEMHDPITGPSDVHYTPTYFGYQPPHSFDCLWGHEFMWDSLNNLLSGQAVSLYYYNLAYSIPIYLHVNLKNDNTNALVLWWYASTCRHLGVGGKSPDPAIWEAQKKAMQTYLSLKPFFTQGEFYGLDEMIHVHTLPEKNAAVINCFNLADTPETKTFTIPLAEVGLSAQSNYEIQGAAAWKQQDSTIEVKVEIPAQGTQLLELIPKS